AKEPVMLSDENSLWGADVYIAVEKEVTDADMQKISGTFMTKVFEGPYKDARQWCRQMQEYVQGKGEQFKKMYYYYTTCPKCAKVYGKNYVVLLAEL
ncbi:hydrolase, partial [Planctomycetota bacterium]